MRQETFKVNLSVVHTVYVMQIRKNKNSDEVFPLYIKESRVWGWFGKFEDAESIVLNNVTDIFEYYYNYALIEEVEEGVMNKTKVIQWYKADYEKSELGQTAFGNRPVIEKTECPKGFGQIVGFTMG